VKKNVDKRRRAEEQRKAEKIKNIPSLLSSAIQLSSAS
jgi:hypothetical protein